MKQFVNEFISHFLKDKEGYNEIRETLLSNLILLNEIPAPTFKEFERATALVKRYAGYEILNGSVDEMGNALGIIPGKNSENNILVVAHLDTHYDSTVDHNVSVNTDHIIGPGVGDNGLGLAAMATLPYLLKHFNLELDSNLILMGSARSLGMGDIEGIRFFLNNFKGNISSGICLEGVKLGRLSYSSIGMLRGELVYQIPEEYDWTKFSSEGALVNMNEMISKILEIPLPRKPKTSIVLGSIRGGTSYNTIPTKVALRFEIRSESNEVVDKLTQEIDNLAMEMSSLTGANVEFKKHARRKPGGTLFSHPLNRVARDIHSMMNIKTRLSPSTSELSAFIAKGIPAITIGLTHGENLGEENEQIDLSLLDKGMAQLLGLLISLDRGFEDEED
ncbi:MAG: peptidase dimerization domain-containing protein [Spirochaetaceae bacterium]|jgi:tripeptide aminopeptidase|nr:peptidase dimerization domain-containing protein [Spirochaetaceae bacterium]